MTELLLFLAIATPALLTPLWLWRPLRRVAGTVTPFAALPALAAALAPAPPHGIVLSDIFTGLTYNVDALGRAFLLLTAVLWTAGGCYARAYIRRDADRPVFFGFFLLTMCGNIGVTVAGDALAFYLHFALMTFAAYGLIVHDRTPDAVRAGRVYIAMAVAGEAALLAALLMLGAHGESLRFANLAAYYPALEHGAGIALLFAIGFAVKAGLAPLHLWLPLAHPVAPTPASALLSGAMIKAGLIGWLRFLPLGSLELTTLGSGMIVAGVGSALLAVALGVMQPSPKIVLAYSSVSQMGFMAVAIGAGLLLPQAAPALILAATLYALHHGLAKAALFLGVGVAPSHVGARERRWTVYVAALPALALAGAPLTSGALAKAALTGGVAALPAPWPAALDTLLAFAAIGTTLLMARFLAVLSTPHAPPHGKTLSLLVPWLALVALSAVAAFWLPLAFRPAEGVDLPGPFYGIGKSAWPITIGVVLAAAVWRFRARFAYLQRARVPAGDAVVLIERMLQRRRATRPDRLRTPTLAISDALHRASGAVAGALGRIAARDQALAGGASLGMLLTIVALLLAAALLIGS